MNLIEFDAKVIATIFGAVATIAAALIQLRIAWRKELQARARGVPVTKKSRRGPVLAVVVLLVAAGVGGFAFSQYLMVDADRESAALRGELQVRLAQISASADRLEQARLKDRDLIEAEARRAEDQRRGAEGVAVTTTVGPCRPQAFPFPDGPPACSEREASAVTLCASVPATAAVAEVLRYARPEDSQQPWAESRVNLGQNIGRARFGERTFERPETDKTKQVCSAFSSWDADHPYSARIVVKYTSPESPSARDISHAAVTPASARTP